MTDVKAYEPPTIQHRADDGVDVERVLIFAIERPNPRAGEPVDPSEADGETGRVHPATLTDLYTMPRKPNVGMSLAYLKQARRMGAELAGSWLIEEALGSDAYDALAAEKDLEPEDLERIIAKVQKTALGGLENPKGS